VSGIVRLVAPTKGQHRRWPPERPNYLVHAGVQLVGRMYRCHGVQELWFWGVNAVTLDATVVQCMHGFAATKSSGLRLIAGWNGHWRCRRTI
jgi:hypothetical protein